MPNHSFNLGFPTSHQRTTVLRIPHKIWHPAIASSNTSRTLLGGNARQLNSFHTFLFRTQVRTATYPNLSLTLSTKADQIQLILIIPKLAHPRTCHGSFSESPGAALLPILIPFRNSSSFLGFLTHFSARRRQQSILQDLLIASERDPHTSSPTLCPQLKTAKCNRESFVDSWQKEGAYPMNCNQHQLSNPCPEKSIPTSSSSNLFSLILTSHHSVPRLPLSPANSQSHFQSQIFSVALL
jgi:hypothetical protein